MKIDAIYDKKTTIRILSVSNHSNTINIIEGKMCGKEEFAFSTDNVI